MYITTRNMKKRDFLVKYPLFPMDKTFWANSTFNVRARDLLYKDGQDYTDTQY